MKSKLPTIVLGLVLILSGAYALLNQFGVLEDLTPVSAIIAFAVLSVIFFLTYFVSGIQNWGWLFPAFIFAALAGTMAVVESTIPSEWIATMIVGSCALPFLVAFFLDRTRWWALIPAFILGFVAFIPAMTTFASGEWVGALVVAAIGLPFLVVYLVSPKNWWAVIPAGVMFSIAVLILLTMLPLPGDEDGLAVSVMFLGWASTFGFLWFRRSVHGTDWAKLPALILGGLAVFMLFISVGGEYLWAIALILLGLVMVLLSFRKREVPDIDAGQVES